MKFLLFFIMTTLTFSSVWQAEECPLASNQYLEQSSSFYENFSFSCSSPSDMDSYNGIRSKVNFCAAGFVKKATSFVDTGNCTNDSSISVKLNYIKYTKKTSDIDCGSDAIHSDSNTCVCNNPNLTFNSSTSSCSCPAGQTVDSEGICINSCEPLSAPYQSTSFSQSECTQSNLQSLYNQNNTDGRIINDVKWNCDNKCYFTFSDNNTPDNNSTVTGSNNNSNNNSNNIDTSGIEQRLDTVNNNLNTLNNTVQNNTSSLGNKIDSIGSNIDSLGTKIDSNGQIMSDNGQKIDSLRDTLSNELKFQGDRLHDDLQDLTSSLNDNNTSNAFDDTRIVNSIHQNTEAINEIKDLHQGETDADTSFFDTYQGYYNDIIQSVNDVENNVNDLMATIQGDYTPNFQNYNSCTINFPIFNKSVPYDMCKYSPILKPYFTFILTVLMLILLIRLHFYLFPKLMRSD